MTGREPPTPEGEELDRLASTYTARLLGMIRRYGTTAHPEIAALCGHAHVMTAGRRGPFRSWLDAPNYAELAHAYTTASLRAWALLDPTARRGWDNRAARKARARRAARSMP